MCTSPRIQANSGCTVSRLRTHTHAHSLSLVLSHHTIKSAISVYNRKNFKFKFTPTLTSNHHTKSLETVLKATERDTRWIFKWYPPLCVVIPLFVAHLYLCMWKGSGIACNNTSNRMAKSKKKKNNKRDTYRSYRESVMNVIEDWKITGVRIKQKWESDSCLNNAEGLIVCLAVACMFEWEHIKPNIVYTSVETTWKMEKQLWLFWDWIVTKPNSQTARCWWRGLFAWDCSCTDEYMVHRFATFDNW